MNKIAVSIFLGAMAVSASANARSCHIVQCEQKRHGEVCTITPCSTGQTLACYSGLFTVGDGNRVFRSGTQGQCEQRCEADQNCSYLEYYFGKEGVKCNLYYGRPQLRWNANNDATVCAWK